MAEVSIILPAYNSENTIAKTIESILNQNFENFELLLINDGSTDRTEAICKNYSSNDKRIKYFKLKNGGVSKARNFGIAKVSSPLIVFIDSDDLYEHNYLEELLNDISKNDYDLCICGYNCFGGSRKKISLVSSFSSNKKNIVIETLQPKLLFNQLWNKIYKTKIIRSNNILFDESLDLGEDALFNIKYLKHAKMVHFNKECLYNYRISNSGLGFKYREDSGKLKLVFFKEMLNMYQDKKYNSTYVYMNIIKQYVSCISNVVDFKNNTSLKYKLNKINYIIKDQLLLESLSNCEKKSWTFFVNITLKNKYLAYITGICANIFNYFAKKLKFGGEK